MNLLLAESPFQLLQGVELECINGRTIYIVRTNSNKRNNSQMRELLRVFDISNVFFIGLGNKISLIIHIPFLFFLVLLSNRLYVGDENSILFRSLKRFMPKRKVVLLDDGVATLSLDASRDYKRFTIFDAVPGERNGLNKARLLVEQVQKTSSIDVIVGGKLVEENICSIATYEKILDQMLTDLQGSNNRTIYIPHRGEDLGRLKEWSNKYDFEIYLNELPIELIGFELRADVVSVLSVMSTALFSMSLIYREARIKVYPLDPNSILNRVAPIENLYKIMRDQSLFGLQR